MPKQMPAPALSFRSAERADITALVRMLADDKLGALRERPEPMAPAYVAAFHAIDEDANNDLIVAEHDGGIAGFLQLTFIPYLTYQGSWRALIESVRVKKEMRDHGVGGALVRHAVGRARDRECHLVQLTTDKQRPEALAFYERLGFRATHEGLKLHLEPT